MNNLPGNTTVTINKNSKKQIYIIILLFIGLVVAISVFSWSTINNKNAEITSLNDDLSKTKTELQNEQSKLNKVLYAVHPEQDYKTFRKEAYMDIYRQVFPNEDGDNRNFALVRVFHATAFREADKFFNAVQNDDIMLYQHDNVKDISKGAPTVIVRPREQKVIASGNLDYKIIEKARSDNFSRGVFSKPINFLSDQ